MRLAASGAALLLATACGDYFMVCPPADEAALEGLPASLSDTGLDGDGVLAYRPSFELWSDGAAKRRWLWLPPDETIDTRDMDDWQFPIGTRVWKEFSRGGVPIETRLIQRTEEGWVAQAYVWTADGADAVATPTGYVDAGGTTHDVPGAGECAGCHGGRRSFVLGVSAVQLSHPAEADEVDLAGLVARGLLSEPPADPSGFAVPGDDTERAALGYLHANCGHCHNQVRPPTECFDPQNELDFWLQVGRLDAPADTPTYDTAVGAVIAPGEPASSTLIDRAGTRTIFYRMPPLGSEEVDRDALAVLRRWIAEME